MFCGVVRTRSALVYQIGSRFEGGRLAEEYGASDLSCATVRNYVRVRRPEIDAVAGRCQDVFVPQERAPGVDVEVDFGEVWVILAGVKTKCHMFTFRLSRSGKMIHRIYPAQVQEAPTPIRSSATPRFATAIRSLK